MFECSLPDCTNKVEDTHHIKEQHTADSNGFIDTIHKNNGSNLLPLCKRCHNDIHHGTIRIDGFNVTTKGVKLKYTRK